MATIKDERLKLWSETGDAMSAGNFVLAGLRMRVFAGNFQDIKPAFEKWKEFDKTINTKCEDQHKTVEAGAKNLNPLQRYQAMGVELAGIDEWGTWERYYFLYRIATEHKMFPTGIVDLRPRGDERRPRTFREGEEV